jgi:hypothetical protein
VQFRRAKIKLMAKKSLETGEDIDSIPESMRNYLALQAMETGKGIGMNFFGRPGMPAYGQGNMFLGGEQGGQGKVCKCNPSQASGGTMSNTCYSDSPLDVPISQHRQVDSSRTEHHGLDHLLLP